MSTLIISKFPSFIFTQNEVLIDACAIIMLHSYNGNHYLKKKKKKLLVAKPTISLAMPMTNWAITDSQSNYHLLSFI